MIIAIDLNHDAALRPEQIDCWPVSVDGFNGLVGAEQRTEFPIVTQGIRQLRFARALWMRASFSQPNPNGGRSRRRFAVQIDFDACTLLACVLARTGKANCIVEDVRQTGPILHL
jgi:hypothetical protein